MCCQDESSPHRLTPPCKQTTSTVTWYYGACNSIRRLFCWVLQKLTDWFQYNFVGRMKNEWGRKNSLNLGRSRTRGGFRSVALWQTYVLICYLFSTVLKSDVAFLNFKYSLLSRKRKGAHLQILFIYPRSFLMHYWGLCRVLGPSNKLIMHFSKHRYWNVRITSLLLIVITSDNWQRCSTRTVPLR